MYLHVSTFVCVYKDPGSESLGTHLAVFPRAIFSHATMLSGR